MNIGVKRETLNGLLALAVLLAVIGGIGFAIHANAGWLAVHWSMLLFGTYVTVGVGLMIASQVVSTATSYNDKFFLAKVEAGFRKVSAVERIRLYLTNILARAMDAFTWPASFVKSLRRVGKPSSGKHATLSDSMLAAERVTIEPLSMLAALGITTVALAATPPPVTAALLFCGCAIAYVGVLCTFLVVSPIGLGSYLRGASGNPYAKAAGLALITTATLCIAYANIEARGVPSGTHLIAAARGLYAQWDSIQRLLTREPVSGWELLQGTSGVLVFSAVVSSLLSAKEFVRTDEDLVTMGWHKLHLGRMAEALTIVDAVKAHNAASLFCRATALAGVSQVGRAIEVWSQAQALDATSEPVTSEKSVQTLLVHLVGFPVRSDILLAIFGRLVASRPTESALILTARLMTSLARVPAPEVAAALSAERGEVYPLALADLLAMPPTDERDLKRAAELVEYALPTGMPLDCLRAEILLRTTVHAQPSSPEIKRAFEAWCARELPQLGAMATKQADIDQLLVLLAVVGRVVDQATRFSSPQLEEAKHLLASLASRCSANLPDKEFGKAFLGQVLPDYMTEQ
jgi:hypothetical protein